MKTLLLLQTGKERSIVKVYHSDTKESEVLIINNTLITAWKETGIVIH